MILKITAKTYRLIIVMFFAMVVPAAAAKLSEQDIYSQFRRANDIFRQANLLAGDHEQARQLYGQAVLHYERIVNEGGIKNAMLYYNLADAYLLKDDIGMAILNYRLAEKLDPADGDIKKNLAFARSRRIDKVQVKTEKRILQTLFFWHYDFSSRTRLFLASLFFGLLFAGLTGLLWLPRRGWLGVSCVLAAVLVVCFSVSVMVEAYQSRHKCGVIVAESVMARQGDGDNYPPSFKQPLHAGTEFEVIEQRSGWLHIQLSDGSTGWIQDSSGGLL